MASPRQTQAARLSNDVLLQVFYHLETDECLCAAALVCRAWTPASQALLYNTLCLGPWDPGSPSTLARSTLLARTLRSSPHLLPLVRFLSLDTSADAPRREHVEWLHLLPAHGLARFRYMWHSEGTFDASVLSAPAVRTVPHLIAHGPQNSSTLRACLSLPNLETLEVSLADYDDGDGGAGCQWGEREREAIHAGLAPRLRKLIIRVYFVACPPALALFAAFAPQLAAFQLHALFELFEPHRAWAAALTALPSLPPLARTQNQNQNQPHLKQLVLSGAAHWTRAGAPFMDAVVRAHRGLERVRCPLGSYTDAFFRALPPSVRVLELYVDPDSDARSGFAHERALVALLLRLREAGQRGPGGGLREVRFLSQYRTTAPVSAKVLEAARAGGVRVACVRAGLYTPVRCMSEADVVESSFGSDFCH